MNLNRFSWRYDVSILIIALFVIAFGVICLTVGPGEALRAVVAEALIFAAMFAVARRWLPWEDAERERIKYPRLELALGLFAYLLILYSLVNYFDGGTRWLTLALTLGLPVVVLLAGRYSANSWGLRWPTAREWLVLAVVILINIGLGRLLGGILPAGELPTPAGADLMEGGLLASLVTVLLVAAIPEELFFRVFLQSRLAAYLPGRWALFVQALLFSAAHLPQQLLSFGNPPAYALSIALLLTNGVMAGYVWRKTGNLLLLILLHLFAFARFGL